MLLNNASSEVVQSANDFGQIVHRAAARLGSKTELGKKIGQDKAVIMQITRGKAHLLEDMKILDKLVEALASEVHPTELTRLRQLAKTMRNGN